MMKQFSQEEVSTVGKFVQDEKSCELMTTLKAWGLDYPEQLSVLKQAAKANNLDHSRTPMQVATGTSLDGSIYLEARLLDKSAHIDISRYQLRYDHETNAVNASCQDKGRSVWE
jgi:hypothetical protein